MASEVGFHHLLITLNLFRRSFSDGLPEIEDGDVFADAHHDLHIEFDQDDGYTALIPHLAEQFHRVFTFVGVHAGCRFI